MANKVKRIINIAKLELISLLLTYASLNVLNGYSTEINLSEIYNTGEKGRAEAYEEARLVLKNNTPKDYMLDWGQISVAWKYRHILESDSSKRFSLP